MNQIKKTGLVYTCDQVLNDQTMLKFAQDIQARWNSLGTGLSRIHLNINSDRFLSLVSEGPDPEFVILLRRWASGNQWGVSWSFRLAEVVKNHVVFREFFEKALNIKFED